MPKYIDAEKTKEHKFAEARFERYFEIISSGRATTDDVIYAYKVGYNEAIDNIADFEPTADVVEVVRCEYCKWFPKFAEDEINTAIQFRCKKMNMFYSINHFCAFGERREDAEIH